LIRVNGSTFTVLYLKESLRLTYKTIGGEAALSSDEPRVATRRGLPLIIPGLLRLEIEKRSVLPSKVILTILSVFRVMDAWPKLKLSTITSPSTGIVNNVPELALVLPLLKKFMGIKSRKYFNPENTGGVVGCNLLTLTTAGPNHKNQLLGYPIDAYAFSKNPSLLNTFRMFAMQTQCKDLYDQLMADISVANESNHFSDVPDCQLKLGKLALKLEAAGKVRVFAIVDA